MGKPQLRYTSRWDRLLAWVGLKKQIKVYAPARETRVRPAPVFQFKCKDCGEEWEKGLYRVDSQYIMCKCGGKGMKMNAIKVDA